SHGHARVARSGRYAQRCWLLELHGEVAATVAALPCDADDPGGYAEQDERESEHRVRVGGASGVSDRITGNAKNGPETTGRAGPLCQLRKGAARPPHAPGASLCARSAGTAGIGDHEFSPSIMSGDRSAG